MGIKNNLFGSFRKSASVKVYIEFKKEKTMKMNIKWQGIVVAALFAMTISPVLAQDTQEGWSQDLPQVFQQGEITYISGGNDLDERNALKAAARNYNLIISNAVKGGNFTEGQTIVITNKGNQKTLTINDAGPLFYAKLPAGTYIVKAVSGNEKAERTVSISGQKQERIHFIWSN
jgi:hypothetical protein